MNVVAATAAMALTIVAIARGTFAVGGSDSSCYALMAQAFAHGAAQPSYELAQRVPWPDASRTFAPGGFIPSPIRLAAASPICAPGFSLLMTPFYWIAGRTGIFFVTPIAAGVLVWCAFVVAKFLAGPVAGAVASILVATSPIVLFQSMQPMNDIATAALWMAALAVATREDGKGTWMMGVLSGVAIPVRPNLAPLGLVVAIWMAGRSRSGSQGGSKGGSEGASKDPPLQAITKFTLAAMPGVFVAMMLNWALYGDPIRLGYGNATDLFAVQHLLTNVTLHGRAWIETQTPFAVLALAAPFVIRGSRRSLVWLGLGLSMATIGVYLFYQPFAEWWYLRFLLPAVVILTTFAAAILVSAVRRTAPAMVATAVIAAFGIQAAAKHDVFNLQRLESRFPATGYYARDKLPPNALFFTVFDSGAIRFHGEREAVLWDSLDPLWFDRAIAWSQSHGREPFIVIERFEEPAFRSRFAASSALGALDWPPRAEIHRQVRIYAPSDRAAYVSGRPVPTEYVWP